MSLQLLFPFITNTPDLYYVLVFKRFICVERTFVLSHELKLKYPVRNTAVINTKLISSNFADYIDLELDGPRRDLTPDEIIDWVRSIHPRKLVLRVVEGELEPYTQPLYLPASVYQDDMKGYITSKFEIPSVISFERAFCVYPPNFSQLPITWNLVSLFDDSWTASNIDIITEFTRYRHVTAQSLGSLFKISSVQKPRRSLSPASPRTENEGVPLLEAIRWAQYGASLAGADLDPAIIKAHTGAKSMKDYVKDPPYQVEYNPKNLSFFYQLIFDEVAKSDQPTQTGDLLVLTKAIGLDLSRKDLSRLLNLDGHFRSDEETTSILFP